MTLIESGEKLTASGEHIGSFSSPASVEPVTPAEADWMPIASFDRPSLDLPTSETHSLFHVLRDSAYVATVAENETEAAKKAEAFLNMPPEPGQMTLFPGWVIRAVHRSASVGSLSYLGPRIYRNRLPSSDTPSEERPAMIIQEGVTLFKPVEHQTSVGWPYNVFDANPDLMADK